MKLTRIGVLLFGLMSSHMVVRMCGAEEPHATPPPSVPQSYMVLGFYSQYLAPGAAFNSLQSFSSYLNAVSMAVFAIDGAGAINGSIADSRAIGFARAKHIRMYAAVSNTDANGFNAALGHSALTTNESVLIANLLALAKNTGFDGIDLDFEGLNPKDRSAYSNFVHDLAAALHSHELKLILSVPAKQGDDPTNTWSGAFDYKAIGHDADLLQMMTYDQHIPGHDAPGPIAGSDWVAASIRYAITVVAPSKLLIGLPAYGYDWVQKADGTWAAGNSNFRGIIPWTQSPAQAVRWDATSNSPYVDSTDANGLKHEVWFENPLSIRAKVALAKQYRVAGVSVWQIGEEDLSFWQAIAASLK